MCWMIAAGVGRVSAQHLVRTDSREQKLDAFLVPHASAAQRTAVDAADSVALSLTDRVSVFYHDDYDDDDDDSATNNNKDCFMTGRKVKHLNYTVSVPFNNNNMTIIIIRRRRIKHRF